MWYLVIGLSLAVFLIVMAYLVSRFPHFAGIKKLTHEKKRWGIFIGTITLVGIAAGLLFAMDLVNMIICMLQLGGVWLLCDLTSYLVKRSVKSHLQDIMQAQQRLQVH